MTDIQRIEKERQEKRESVCMNYEAIKEKVERVVLSVLPQAKFVREINRDSNSLALSFKCGNSAASLFDNFYFPTPYNQRITPEKIEQELRESFSHHFFFKVYQEENYFLIQITTGHDLTK